MLRLFLALSFSFFTFPALAQLKTVEVTADVYAIIGPITQRSPGNLANNATFGLIVTPAGAVLIDAGGTRLGAQKIEAEIKAITDLPVTLVIDTGGQDHRWFGNAYWAEKGARIVTSNAAIEDQKARGSLQRTMLMQLVGPAGVEGTDLMPAPEGFDDRLEITLGEVRMEIIHTGPAHTPGDAFVWLPDQKVVFGGDIVVVERMLGLTAESSSRGWLEAFAAIEALSPDFVIPGHGDQTDILTASHDTADYLTHLRAVIGAHIEAGGDIITSVDVDQSDFLYLKNSDQLAKRNAQRAFEEMEWE